MFKLCVASRKDLRLIAQSIVRYGGCFALAAACTGCVSVDTTKDLIGKPAPWPFPVSMQKDSCPDISGIYLSKPIDKKVEKASPLDSLANLFFLYTPGRLNTPPWIWAEAFKVNVKLSGRDMMSLVATDQAGLREFTREVPSSSRECRDGVMFFSWADQSAGEDGTHDRFRYLGVYRTDAGQLVVTHNQRDRQRPFPLVSMTAEKHDWYLFAQSRE